MSPMKEPHFFSRIDPAPRLAAFFPHVTDQHEYLALFSAAGDATIRGEASTSYLSHEQAVEAIARASPLREDRRHAPRPHLACVLALLERRPRGHRKPFVRRSCGRGARRSSRTMGRFVALISTAVSTPNGSRATSMRSPATFSCSSSRSSSRPLGLISSGQCGFLGVDPRRSALDDLEPQNVFALPRNSLSRAVLGSGRARDIARRLLPRAVRAHGRELLVAPAAKPALDPAIRRRLQCLYRDDAERLSRLLGRTLPWPEFDSDNARIS